MLNVSIQECCRDRRKIGQVIDRMRILGSNLDELRTEIAALRDSYKTGERNHACETGYRPGKDSRGSILQKVKKYVRKVTSATSFRKGEKNNNDRKAYYPCANLDPTLPAFLNYMLRMGKKGGLWQMPTGIKYFKCQANQTDEELRNRRFSTDSPTVSMHAHSIENVTRDGSSFDRGGGKFQNKIMFPRKEPDVATEYSEISCDLDVQVDDPIFSPSATEINIFPDSCIIKNYSDNMEVCLQNGNSKESATRSTQTIGAEKTRQKCRNQNTHARHPNFSKIRNAVITRKVVRSSNESSFTVCGKGNDSKRYRYNNKRSVCKRCDCRLRNGNDSAVNSNGQDVDERNFFVDENIMDTKRRDVNDANDQMYREFSFEEFQNASSSSGSVNLELRVSETTDKAEEFPDRRRPRTYLVREIKQKNNEIKKTKHFQNGFVYMGPTSDLTLSSCSFSNQNVPCK